MQEFLKVEPHIFMTKHNGWTLFTNFDGQTTTNNNLDSSLNVAITWQKTTILVWH